QTVVREALRSLLDTEEDFLVVATAATAADTLALGAEPDVVVTDVDLPDARGRQVVSSLRQSFQSASIFVLSGVDHPAWVQRIISAGADGYLLKTAPVDELLVGIRAVAQGQRYLQPSLGVELARWHGSGAEGSPGSTARLSPKEERVLQLLALGHTNSEIAAREGVSLRTVETHRARIMQKLGRRTRAELVRYAREAGLIDDADDDG
ncbi:MAG TPA: response regulator transcription factor, partial [Thermoleophilia bacterium]|nr:response regulator transcription factor [Thermoleophilia bacterium]